MSRGLVLRAICTRVVPKLMQVVAAAMNGAKSNDGMKAAAWLHANGNIATAMGSKSFDSKGDLTVSDYVMYEWKDGNYAEK